MNDNRSVATIDSPEFIDIKPYNPLISQCQIKVLYLGRNRNGSFIDKNTAIQMANSLPACPIVGVWRDEKEDFGDHGHVITIEDNEIKFACKTVPYGFVAPDARVWFQKFVDTDEFGEETEREYMMTTGYLWTGQFEEAMSVIEDGKGQSMELDESSLEGHWANDSKTGLDFFIINDAVFSKLCILGDDVEPCFEGASISAQDQYSNKSDFAVSLYTMMHELKDMLSSDEGGLKLKKEFIETNGAAVEQNQSAVAEVVEEEATTVVEEQEPETQSEEEENSVVEEDDTAEVEDDAEDEDSDADESDEDGDSGDADFVKKEDENETSDENSPENNQEDEEDKEKKQVADNACGRDKKKYNLTDDEIDSLYSELESLKAFKLAIENKEKDALIDKYHMLSDEDKADIVAHKEEYSLEQIEEKLALVYVKKNVDFDTVDGHKEEVAEDVESFLNFSLDDSNGKAEVVSDIQAAFREM